MPVHHDYILQKYVLLTCIEFSTVNIQASGSESLSNKNSNPTIQVIPSKGNSAKMLINITLQ